MSKSGTEGSEDRTGKIWYQYLFVTTSLFFASLDIRLKCMLTLLIAVVFS